MLTRLRIAAVAAATFVGLLLTHANGTPALAGPDAISESAYRYGPVDAGSGLRLGIALEPHLVTGTQISVYTSVRNDRTTKSATFHLGRLKVAVTDASGKSVPFKQGLMSFGSTAGPVTSLAPGQSFIEIRPLIAGPAGSYTLVASRDVFNEDRSATIGTLTSAPLSVTIAPEGS